jgi:ATP-binding cassette ChvD family protein
MANLVSVERASLALGTTQILEGVSLGVSSGTRVGVVGRNGGGKSTLLRVLAGLQPVDEGRITTLGSLTVGMLTQVDTLDPGATVRKAVLGDLPEHVWAGDPRIRDILDGLLGGIDAPDVGGLEAIVGPLSGGERRRLALAGLLAADHDLLLLDEPTNHLDAESVLWLEQHLASYHGAVLAVTHDRYFLDNVAQWIAEIDRGRLYPYEGNYSTYLQKKSERLTVQGKKDAKLAKRLVAELEWVRSNAKARQIKSKARLSRYEEMAAEADRTRKLDFEEIQIPPGPRLGSTVIEVNNLKKGYDGRVLIDDLSFTLPRNGIVGVIGANGVGKTTLFKTIVGLEEPDEGNVKIGETVKISYVDQGRSGLDPTKNLWETVSDGLDYIQVGHVEIPSRAYVSQFGFKGPDQQKMTGVLSGGERNRLNLALTLKVGGNLLLLDEPTNDLDVETLGSLENALLEFPGCAVVISHDRWFLDRVVTHILSYEGDDDNPGQWYWFEGNFQAYEANKVERLGPEASRPHRVTYRKLTRS